MNLNAQHQHASGSADSAMHGGREPAVFQAPAARAKLIRLPVVESLTGLKRSSIYGQMRARTFPGSVRLSTRAVAWRESEVLAWCEERIKTKGNDEQA